MIGAVTRAHSFSLEIHVTMRNPRSRRLLWRVGVLFGCALVGTSALAGTSVPGADLQVGVAGVALPYGASNSTSPLPTGEASTALARVGEFSVLESSSGTSGDSDDDDEIEDKDDEDSDGPAHDSDEDKDGAGGDDEDDDDDDDDVDDDDDDDEDDDSDDAGELKGAVESLPAGSLLGTWVVAGKSVTVVSTTRIDQERGAVAVGTVVEVEGLFDAASNTIVASKIEVKAGAAGSPSPVPALVELYGTIEALPAGGAIGTWTVAGRSVIVSATTKLEAEHGPFAVGASVEAKGAFDATGALLATEIETKAGNGAAVPALEFWGTVVALPTGPSGLVGVWQIGDRFVNVTAATEIETEDAPLEVGATVKVHGWIQPDGVVEAREIETRTAIGVSDDQGKVAVEFVNATLGHFFVTANTNEIAALDAGAFAGSWTRTGQTFNVGGGTNGVCRFYGMPPKGPDSHFFTSDPAECRKVMQDYQAWTFEGHAFAMTPPVNGQCPTGTTPVYRFYNNAVAGSDMNHRYVVTQEAYAQTVAMGWTLEGIVMCAQP